VTLPSRCRTVGWPYPSHLFPGSKRGGDRKGGKVRGGKEKGNRRGKGRKGGSLYAIQQPITKHRLFSVTLTAYIDINSK